MMVGSHIDPIGQLSYIRAGLQPDDSLLFL
jgi:hypothetical protein